jgi:uncharacterized protein YdhG (YjbR/CyaY superfamily)
MKKMSQSSPVKTVDDYIASQPSPEVREALERLRSIIVKTAPEALEVISYGMPGYKLHGMLVYFAAFKNHCSFFPGSRMVSTLKTELKGFKTAKGTIQFTVEKQLPVALVKKIIKSRIKDNLAKISLRTRK